MNDTLSIADFAELDYTSGELRLALESTDTPLHTLLSDYYCKTNLGYFWPHIAVFFQFTKVEKIHEACNL